MSRPRLSPSEHGDEATARYARPEYQAFLADLERLAADVAASTVDVAGVPRHHSIVTSRRKATESFRVKASKAHDDDPDLARYLYPCEDITDQVAVRIMTLLPSQAGAVADAWRGLEATGVRVRESQPRPVERGKFGYMSYHRLVEFDEHPDCPAPPAGYRIPKVEVQVRTQLQHVWAELEHDVRYKGNADPDVSRRFDRVAALVELADSLLQEAVDLTEAPTTPAVDDGERGDPGPGTFPPGELRSILADVFPDARPSRADAQTWILQHVVGMGIGTPAALRDALGRLDLSRIHGAFAALGYADRPQVRCLDDALLAIGQDDYVERVMTTFPEPTRGSRGSRARNLRWRLAQLRDAGVL